MLNLTTLVLFGLIVATNCFIYNETSYLEHIKKDNFFRDYYHPWYNQTVYFLQSLSDSNELNPKCRSSLKRWISGIEDKETWAIKFLESTGRTINGKLTGRNLNFGSFDFCTQFVKGDAENVDFDGKYCLVSVLTKEFDTIKTLPNFKDFHDQLTDRSKRFLNFNMGNAHGICMPHTCEIEEITLVTNKMFKSYGLSILPPKNCVTLSEPEKWDYLQLFALAILSTFVFLCILSLFIQNEFLSNFSIIDNLNIIYNTNYKDEESKERTYLHGAKASMLICSIGLHTLFHFGLYFSQPFGSIKEQKTPFLIQIFFERLVLFASLMFFFGGFFAMYSWFDVIKNRTVKFNFRVYLLVRFIRIAAISIPIILITLILPHFGTGPYYSDLTNHFYQNCVQNGYKIFFLSTNLNDSFLELCNTFNWYLSADYQVSVFAYFIVYYLVVKPKIAFAIAIVQSLVFAAIPILYHAYWSMPPFSNTLNSDLYGATKLHEFYFPFFFHFNVYSSGILCAYLIKTNKKPKVLDNIAFRIAVWILLALLVSFVFCYPHYLEQNNLEGYKIVNLFYQAFDKVIVSLIPGWGFYTMHFGYSRILLKLARLKLWIPWSRLSFSISLGQFISIPYFIALSRNGYVSTPSHFIKEFLINLIFAFILGNLIFLFFEAPLRSIFQKKTGLRNRSEIGIQVSQKSTSKALSNHEHDLNMNLKED